MAGLTAGETHPHEVLREAGFEDSALCLEDGTLAQLWRYRVETGIEEIDSCRNESRGLSGEEIDDRIARIGQTKVSLLDVEVRGDAPEALLARGPETVGDIVEEPTLSFDTLGKEKRFECTHAGTAHAFIMCPIAVARILQENGSRHLGPMEPEVALACLKQSLARLWAKCLPGSAVLNRGKGPVFVGRNERGLQLFRTARLSQEISLATARRRCVNVSSEGFCE